VFYIEVSEMNFCAIVFGESKKDAKTLASLAGFDNLMILRVSSPQACDLEKIEQPYTFFIKSGDALSTDAKYWLTLTATYQSPDIIYSDESLVYAFSQEQVSFYKPDYSPEMILSMNYFRNLLCVKTDLLKNIALIESEGYENFLYEVVLKILVQGTEVVHIREALYISYANKDTANYADYFAAFDQTAGRKQLEYYCQKRQINAEVFDGRYHGTFRLKYAIQNSPLVSIIIPFRDKPELLEECIQSILGKSTYNNIEIIGVNNGSKEKNTFRVMDSLKNKDSRIFFYDLDIPFNYSAINNYAVNHFAKGEHILLLNNDTAVIAPDWIEALLEHSQHPEVGIVGAKLLYPDNTLQHCGVIFSPYPIHFAIGLSDSETGYFYFPHIVRNYHAVTFACVMLKKALFQKVGGLSEIFAVEYNDVDLCARISALGYRNVYTPYAELYHYESKSRGENDTLEKRVRSKWELMMVAVRTPVIFARDTLADKSHINIDLRELIAMQNTLSWRITQPLRIGKKWIKFFMRQYYKK
jgi:GT2 family glycosyltransferase